MQICDICQRKEAVYDGKTIYGPWAFMCEDCKKPCAAANEGPLLVRLKKEKEGK